jgi:serine/threonine protein kinase
MPISTGQMIGDYEIIDVIESSQNGVTYKVRNVMLQRFEALRVLPKSFQDDQDKVTRFLREAKAHARMNHPNVVSFYHATQLDGQLVMTTELVEGTTLARRLELGALPLDDALEYISQVLSGIGHAHAVGVVHRDISPSNIILTPEGRVKLTGFALAKATTDPQLTQPGTVLGSLDYMSPEQVKGLTEIDARSDIYSLGVVFYEALTGQKPFGQKSQFEIMVAHVNTVPVSPSVVKSDLPAELSDIVLKAMAKDPSSRFQTAEAFHQSVDQFRGLSPAPGEEPVVAPAPADGLEAMLSQIAPAKELEEPLPESRWNGWNLLIAGICTFLVVTMAMLAYFMIRGRL